MVNKLIFELGDSNHMKQCDELVKLHHVKNKPTKNHWNQI